MKLTVVNKTAIPATDFVSILNEVFDEDTNSHLVDYLKSKDGVIVNVVDKVTDTVGDSDIILFVTYEGDVSTGLSSELEMTNAFNGVVLIWAVSKNR